METGIAVSEHFFSYPTVTELRPDPRHVSTERGEPDPRPAPTAEHALATAVARTTPADAELMVR